MKKENKKVSNIQNLKKFKKFTSPKNLENLNAFLCLKTFNYKDIPTEKKNRIKFLFLLSQKKSLFLKGGYQICITFYAKKLKVSSQTISNYTKRLIKLGYLTCSNSKWKVGKRSKTYRILKNSNNLEFCNALNYVNGFFENYYHDVDVVENYIDQYKQVLNLVKEQSKQVKIPLSQSEKVKFCSKFKHSPKSLIRYLITNFNEDFLSEPRRENLNETQFLGYFHAYNWVCKVNRLSKNKLIIKEIGNIYGIYQGKELITKVNKDLIVFNRHKKQKYIVEKIKELNADYRFTFTRSQSVKIAERILELQSSVTKAGITTKYLKNYSIQFYANLDKQFYPSTAKVSRVFKSHYRERVTKILNVHKYSLISAKTIKKCSNRYISFK